MVTLFFFLPACLLVLFNLLLGTSAMGPRVAGFEGPLLHAAEAGIIGVFLHGLFFLPAGLGARWIRGRMKRRMPTHPLRFMSCLLIFWNLAAVGPLILLDTSGPSRLIEKREAWLLPWLRTTQGSPR